MMRYLLLYFSVMTLNMCFNCVLILMFFVPSPKKLTMAQLRHLDSGDRDRRHWQCLRLKSAGYRTL